MSKKVAVCILNYNGEGLLEKFLPRVLESSRNAVVYVIDNCSTDNSVRLLESQFASVKLIQNSENKGFTGGYNEGLREVSEEYLLLLNSDVEVTHGWLEPLIHQMDSDENIAACQPKILAQRQKTHFEYAGACGGFIDWLGYPFCRGRIFETTEQDHGQYDSPTQVFWASGACMMIRNDLFRASGGFDESFFAHMEEIDLCWRLQLQGYKIYCNPMSTVYHVGGETLSRENPRKTYLNFRNSASMLYKNTIGFDLYWKFVMKILLDFVAGLKFWKDNSSDHFFAVLHAYRDFFKDLGQKRLIKAKAIKQRTHGTPMVYSKLIVFQYYLRGKKKYSEINQ